MTPRHTNYTNTPFDYLLAASEASGSLSSGSRKRPRREGGYRRAARACVRCRKHKIRCSGSEPCDRCSRSNLVCEFDNEPTKDSVGDEPTQQSTKQQSPSIHTPASHPISQADPTQELREAPFKELLLQSGGLGVWESRGPTRPNSPEHRDIASRRRPAGSDDPIETGLLDLVTATALFRFFIDHCLIFFPIVNVDLPDAFGTIRQSPFLFSAILAIAAKFYVHYSVRPPTSAEDLPLLDPSAPSKLSELAEVHLSHTLLRKQHTLSNVQAILLLSVWGLQPKGKGPDAWIMTGHAGRVFRRLNLDQHLDQAAMQIRQTAPGSEDPATFAGLIQPWRTRLCWFWFDGFFSLGFGRPPPRQLDTVDETSFLRIRLHQDPPRPGTTAFIALCGDVYVAGQVQLTHIARDLARWRSVLAEGLVGGGTTLADMLRELNAKLDEWFRLWVWSGSLYAAYLGSSSRLTRLYAEHIRLSINSYALKSNEDCAHYLRKAVDSAIYTIQTHHDSAQTDLALSFAPDYLTITLAQAATFLVRLKSSEHIHAALHVDMSVMAHYLRICINTLETSDISETRLAAHLAKTVKSLSKAAGVAVGSPQPTVPPLLPLMDEPPDIPFDLDAFLQNESQLDLGYLFDMTKPVALPGAAVPTWDELAWPPG